MHFLCACGYCFHDNSDALSFKGYILADQDEDEMWNIRGRAEKPHDDTIDIASDVMNLLHRAMYQCPECGRMYIEDAAAKYELVRFTPCEHGEPIPDVNRKMLLSAHGDKWRGYLYAQWEDPKPDYCEHKGIIFPICNLQFDDLSFDDFSAFEKRYFDIFRAMTEKNILHRARMTVNRETRHSWEE